MTVLHVKGHSDVYAPTDLSHRARQAPAFRPRRGQLPCLAAGLVERDQGAERELGITVIKRNRTFEGITSEGERVILWARQILASLDALRQDAELVRSVPAGHLAIGVVPTAVHAATLLSGEFRQNMPQLLLEILSLSTPVILQRLKQQDLHLGLVYDRSVTDEAYDVLPLFSERYVLVASDQASLPRELSWAEVSELPLCVLSRDMQNRQMIDEIFKNLEVTPNIVVETNVIRVLLAEAASGRAFSIMPLGALPTLYPNAGIRTHTITPEHAEDICLVRVRREMQPGWSEAAWRLSANLDLQALLDQPRGPRF